MPSSVGDMYEVTALGRCLNQRIMLTAHYWLAQINANVDENTVMQALLDDMAGGNNDPGHWETAYLNCLPTNYTLEGWRVQLIRPIRMAYVWRQRDQLGKHSGTTEIPNLSACLTMRSRASGRRQVANRHIGPVPTDTMTVNNGRLSPTYKGFLVTLGEKMIENVEIPIHGGILVPIIPHPGNNLQFDVIRSYIVQDTVRTMHRRTVGLGE